MKLGTESKLVLLLALVALILILVYYLFGSITEETDSKNIAVFFFDGTGSNYLSVYPELVPEALNEQSLLKASTPNLEGFAEKGITGEISVNFPSTTKSHAATYIAGGCAFSNPKNCVDEFGIVSFCDLGKRYGYSCIMVSQGGDFQEALGEFDIVFHDSSFNEYEVIVNKRTAFTNSMESFFLSWKEKLNYYIPSSDEDKVEKYSLYSAFLIELDAELIDYLEKNFPEEKYILFSNIKGNDSCGHNTNATGYVECIERTDSALQGLIEVIGVQEDLISVISADHGMAFDCLLCKGHHESPPYNSMPESLTVPFILHGGGRGKMIQEMNSFDFFPTVFGYAGINDSCGKMRYCRGKDLSS